MKKVMMGFILPLLLLTGCWDQHLIKDAHIVYIAAFDKGDNGNIKGSAIIRGFVASGGEVGGGTPQNEYVVAEGNNVRNVRMNIDRAVSGTFTASKTRVFLYSEDIAKEGLYPYLDIFYREPSSSLNARLAITKGEANKILEMRRVENTLIGEHTEELIRSSEVNTIVPKLDIQAVCPLFFDPGKDPIVPYIVRKEDKGEEVIDGLALFQDDKLTGILGLKDSTLLLLLMNKKSKVARIVRKVHNDKELDIENYVTIHVSKSQSKMTVNASNGNIENVSFNIKIKANIVEYPADNLGSKKEIDQISKKLSKILTKDMNAMLQKVQEANSDPVGIGRELIAFHPEVWKKLEWRKDYPTIPITAKVQVKIGENGIIN
ncbi:Ger(x)C family spore germination protein [Pseudalkalibacillus sp. Hm43]|uniref:Ger(x)C family spore germination protein n=1 Tax=Pseudalkalibacillus sp. Hm43 TaxID=3450742 RepID=UPI003F430A9A